MGTPKEKENHKKDWGRESERYFPFPNEEREEQDNEKTEKADEGGGGKFDNMQPNCHYDK